LNPYQKAVEELKIVEITEKAILALEQQEATDNHYIHLNVKMIEDTINVLLKLKGTLEQMIVKESVH
tara:strand:+ start:1013 stop:1213 length:201 start_codon:yes stop_codon:yes gene_type:complete